MKKTICVSFFISLLFSLQTVSENAEDPSFREVGFQDGILQIHFLKRLENASKMLRAIHKKGIFESLCCRSEAFHCGVFDNVFFEHEEIERCKKETEETKSLKPFLRLWNSVEERTPHLGVSFFRELSIMVLTIYRAIFTAISPIIQVATQKNFVLHAITLLCGNLSALNAFELLSIVDKLTVQIPKLLEKYELMGSDLTWKQWLNKYWWLPPVAGTAFVLEAIFIYQVAVGKRKLPRLKSLLHVFSKKKKEAHGSA